MQPKHHKHVTDRITKVKCNAATCLIRPQHVGPKPDQITGGIDRFHCYVCVCAQTCTNSQEEWLA